MSKKTNSILITCKKCGRQSRVARGSTVDREDMCYQCLLKTGKVKMPSVDSDE